eukprot:822089-Pleurochrysis_carterae.AAC.1
MPCPLSCRRLDITSIRSNSTAASWNQPGNQPATHTKRASLAVSLASTSSVTARAPPVTPTLRKAEHHLVRSLAILSARLR